MVGEFVRLRRAADAGPDFERYAISLPLTDGGELRDAGYVEVSVRLPERIVARLPVATIQVMMSEGDLELELTDLIAGLRQELLGLDGSLTFVSPIELLIEIERGS